MAKQYGSLVGTIKQTAPFQPVDNAYENGKITRLCFDTVELSANAADTVQLAILGWETVLDCYGSIYSCDDLGTGGTISIGDVTYPTALASAINTDSAALANQKICAAVDIANYGQPLWQMLGYATLAAAKLIGAKCELLLTRNTAAGAGTITWDIKGVPRI